MKRFERGRRADSDVEGVENSDESGSGVFGLVSIHQDVFFPARSIFRRGEESRSRTVFYGFCFLSLHTSFLCLSLSVLSPSGCCLLYGKPDFKKREGKERRRAVSTRGIKPRLKFESFFFFIYGKRKTGKPLFDSTYSHVRIQTGRDWSG